MIHMECGYPEAWHCTNCAECPRTPGACWCGGMDIAADAHFVMSTFRSQSALEWYAAARREEIPTQHFPITWILTEHIPAMHALVDDGILTIITLPARVDPNRKAVFLALARHPLVTGATVINYGTFCHCKPPALDDAKICQRCGTQWIESE